MTTFTRSEQLVTDSNRFSSLAERVNYAPQYLVELGTRLLDRHEVEYNDAMQEAAHSGDDHKLDALQHRHMVERHKWRLKSKLLKLKLEPLVTAYLDYPRTSVMDEIEKVLEAIYAPV